MEKKKIKLLYVVEAFAGGVFSYMTELINLLCDDYDITVAYSLRDKTPENFSDCFDPRIKFIRVENFTRSISPKKDIKAFSELRKIVKAVQPDVIHMHSSKAGAIGRLALSGKKYSLYYTPHGYSFLMRDSSAVKRGIYFILEAVCALSKCTTISCSTIEHKETLKLTKRAVCVNNAVNTAKLDALTKDIERAEHPFTVCTLGRVCFPKNPALFNKIAESMPDVNFLWIGDGEMRDELCAPNIEVTGWLEREEAVKRLACADAFIMTSLWEGLPLSLLEAMYMKLPCIVSGFLGGLEIIRNGETGYVCDDVDEYVKAVNDIRGGGADEYAERAWGEVLKTYNTEVQMMEYDRVYRSGLKK